MTHQDKIEIIVKAFPDGGKIGLCRILHFLQKRLKTGTFQEIVYRIMHGLWNFEHDDLMLQEEHTVGYLAYHFQTI